MFCCLTRNHSLSNYMYISLGADCVIAAQLLRCSVSILSLHIKCFIKGFEKTLHGGEFIGGENSWW